ncbi:Ig-like domain-containing protein [Streptomyces pathocidini]|uniref:Ig-like domain-containing protein n=1 Tax=Streptomyces pathocidini TaxID=1650571 RepID=A0ABW7USH8_9ACTN
MGRTRARTPARRAGALQWAAAVGSVLAALVGCGPPDLGLPGAGLPPEEVIRIDPADGAQSVSVVAPLRVSVPEGRLERVRVVRIGDARVGGSRGSRVIAGRISQDGLRWRPANAAGLQPAARYAVDAVAVDGHGRRVARHTTFTTHVPRRSFIGFYRPDPGSVVGTGMIVSFDFNRPIADRAAVQRAIRISANPPVEIAAHWFGDRRLDLRPRAYWAPGTEVTLRVGLRGVKAGPGSYGIQRRTVRFTVGRSQVSTVDAASHTLTVRRDGLPVATLPVTAGAPGTPTYNGRMVVMSRHEVTRMNGKTVGFGGEYDIPDVPHAIRLTTSGTFLHGNYWTPPGLFGQTNVSHGCIGLQDVQGGGEQTAARWFFDHSMIGDVVEVVNSPERLVSPDNGLSGWNMDWARWRAGSAL